MSYRRYRRRGRRTSILSGFKFTEDPNRPKRQIDVRQYLLNEFLQSEGVQKNLIINFYGSLYGEGPRNYAAGTFRKWQSGTVNPSGKTIDRILECVPKFLSDEQRFEILKSEVVFFFDELRYEHSKRWLDMGQLPEFYQNFLGKVSTFSASNLEWFVGRGIFSEPELKEFTDICRYSMIEKVRHSWECVSADLLLLGKHLVSVPRVETRASYRIDLFDVDIDCSLAPQWTPSRLGIPRTPVSLNGRFREFAHKHIISQILDLSLREKTAQVDFQMTASDLNGFVGKMRWLIGSQVKSDLSGTFKGAGGRLEIRASFWPLSSVILGTVLEGFKLGILLLLLGGVFFLVWGYAESFFAALIVGFLTFGFWLEPLLARFEKFFEVFGKVLK